MQAVAHFAALREHARRARVLPASLLEALRGLLGDRLATTQQVRDHHGTDISSYPTTPPDAVVFPQTTDEVVRSSVPAGHRVPMIPFGVGTSVEGHVLATEGGVCST